MKKTVEVTFSIDVEIDETKFTDKFLQNFSHYFHELDNVDEHIGNIAILHARDRLDEFTEGYGELSSMGIKAVTNDVCANVEEE
jgi:hypothetical protein